MKVLLLIRLLLRRLRISSFSSEKSSLAVFPVAPSLPWPPSEEWDIIFLNFWRFEIGWDVAVP